MKKKKSLQTLKSILMVTDRMDEFYFLSIHVIHKYMMLGT